MRTVQHIIEREIIAHMRLVATLSNPEEGILLSRYLNSLKIENQLELVKNTNWGEPSYGDVYAYIWVQDEQYLEQGLAIAKEFMQDPANPKFQVVEILPKNAPKKKAKLNLAQPAQGPMGKVTSALLFLCCLLFFITAIGQTPPKDAKGLSSLPFFYAPLKKELLFDYPHAFEIIDQLIANFGVKVLQSNELPSQTAAAMLNEFNHTPYWKGLYDKVLTHLQNSQAGWNFSAPLFEKIRQGEVWRFFSPAFLHADIFHILFNMIWLVVLGKQLELRLGALRYVLFVALAALITNTAQYLMGGSNFVGFSGVLCAMLAFVWMRQRQAAWEGYFLQPSTMGFMMVFLGLMLLFQTISFYVEVLYQLPIAPPIANTAHMSGLALGALLGRLNFFAWQQG